MIYSYSYEILPADTVDEPVVGHIKLNSGFTAGNGRLYRVVVKVSA